MRDSVVAAGLLLLVMGLAGLFYDPFAIFTYGIWLVLILVGLFVIVIGFRLMGYTPYFPEDERVTNREESDEPKGQSRADRHGKYCRYCGSLNKEDALFCENCGKDIS